jgi:hypothetical protein
MELCPVRGRLDEVVVQLAGVAAAGVVSIVCTRMSQPRRETAPADARSRHVLRLGQTSTLTRPIGRRRQASASGERAPDRESLGHRLSSVSDPIWTAMAKLPPLKRRTHPILGLLIGGAFGGVGLVVYFRTLADTVVLVSLVATFFVLGLTLIDFGWQVGASVAAFYGFIRSESSNRRLATSHASRGSLPAPTTVSTG